MSSYIHKGMLRLVKKLIRRIKFKKIHNLKCLTNIAKY